MRAKVHIFKRFGHWTYCFRSTGQHGIFLLDREIQAAKAFCAWMNAGCPKRRDGIGG